MVGKRSCLRRLPEILRTDVREQVRQEEKMWNYRIVRKKERTHYTYAIHEAYYDKKGKVGLITQDPIKPFGENIEELRHSWLMMAEAFSQPVLDYDSIPEPGYDRKEDPVGTMLDERSKKIEAGDGEFIPWEEVKKEFEEKLGPFDEEQYYKKVENERKKKEKMHKDHFIGITSLRELIEKLYLDYVDNTKC